MDTTTQRIGAWAGVGFTVLFCIGFLIAGFIPPPDPKDSPEQIAEMFREDKTRIRVGLLITTLASALLALWVAAIGVQMRRIEGRNSILAFAQMVAGACLILEFLFPLLVWQTAAYRTERSPEMIQTLNDLAWLPFLGIACTAVLQGVVIGVLILRDPRPDPLFPRWGGYFNIWVCAMFCPASCVVLAQEGPLAWNGIISWWMAAVTYFLWMIGLTWMLLQAIKRQDPVEVTAESNGAPGSASYAKLERELAELRDRLDRVGS